MVSGDLAGADDKFDLRSFSVCRIPIGVTVSGDLSRVVESDGVCIEVGDWRTKSSMFNGELQLLHAAVDADALLRLQLFWHESIISAEGNLLTNLAACVFSASRKRSSDESERGRGTLHRLFISVICNHKQVPSLSESDMTLHHRYTDVTVRDYGTH